MKVLIAVDQTSFANQVMDAVLSRHWLPGTQFKILTVIEPLPFSIEELALDQWKSFARELAARRVKSAERQLNDARLHVQHAVADCLIHTDLRKGRARDQIIDAAVDWMPDKIILGAHGRSPNRLFPGAVSYSVARHAPCSVELVRLVEPDSVVPARAGKTAQEASAARGHQS